MDNEELVRLANTRCLECGKHYIQIWKWRLCKNCCGRLRRKGQLLNRESFDAPPITLNAAGTLRRHGIKLLEAFDKVKTNPYYTISDVAREFGNSKQWAHDAFFRVVGIKYKVFLKKKAQARKEDLAMLNCTHDPRHLIAEATSGNALSNAKVKQRFIDECKKRNFDVQFQCGAGRSLLVNGHKVAVRSCSFYTYGYGKYGVETLTNRKVEIIVCYMEPHDAFYLIPMPKNKSGIYIRVEQSKYANARNKYFEYYEAWNLLEKEEQTMSMEDSVHVGAYLKVVVEKERYADKSGLCPKHGEFKGPQAGFTYCPICGAKLEYKKSVRYIMPDLEDLIGSDKLLEVAPAGWALDDAASEGALYLIGNLSRDQTGFDMVNYDNEGETEVVNIDQNLISTFLRSFRHIYSREMELLDQNANVKSVDLQFGVIHYIV